MKSYLHTKETGGAAMREVIRARVKRGLLEPLEKVDLPEGKELTIAIMESPTESDAEAFRQAAGSWKGSVDAAKLIRKIYADRLVSTRSKPRL